MAPHEEDLFDEEPPAIEPYTILCISKNATSDEVKSAYRKAALRHHPDKAPPHLKDEAHTKFQAIAFAYAVLSDPIRRKRYDVTGSTSESIDFDGFSWSEFYQEQFRDVVTSEAIEKFAKSYKDSVEERDDILEAYRKFKGKWSGIYNTVMLSDPLEDEDRFRAIIDQAINSEEVQPYKAYTDETAKSKAARMNAARREGAEAVAYAKELGVGEKLFDTGNGGGKESGEEALAALIKKNQAGRSSFFDHLEAKYAGGDSKKSKGKEGRKGKKGKKRTSDEDEDGDDGMPSEEAFQEAAARLQNNKVAAQAGPSDGRKAKRSKR